MRIYAPWAVALIAAFAAPAVAAEVKVVGATARADGGGTYSFSVTLAHADSGWDHYADAWAVLAPDGRVLATRVLAHPHENEQPFTRSLSGVKIPPGLTKVMIRGHDKVHGNSPVLFEMAVPE